MANRFEPVSEVLEQLAKVAVNAAFRVHTELGPGLLESVYEVCLMHEFKKAGLKAERQLPVPVIYDGILLDAALRFDILVADQLVLEIKSVEQLAPLHTAQLMTYLKLTKRRLGLLMNFNVPLIKDGIKRVIVN
jgi:GxxExxY protein